MSGLCGGLVLALIVFQASEKGWVGGLLEKRAEQIHNNAWLSPSGLGELYELWVSCGKSETESDSQHPVQAVLGLHSYCLRNLNLVNDLAFSKIVEYPEEMGRFDC